MEPWQPGAHGGTTSVSSDFCAAQARRCRKNGPRCARESTAATERRPPGICDRRDACAPLQKSKNQLNLVSASVKTKLGRGERR
jgi:hypothetical protein